MDGRFFRIPAMAAPDSHSPFPKTKWSIVLESGRGSAKGEAALAELCQAYWLPLYTFARRSGQAPADAEDLVQGFLAKAVNDELFSRADAGRGKLRTFLLTAFRRYARDERDKAFAEKRGAGGVVSLDLIEAERWYAVEEESPGASPEEAYDRQWAITLLERTCERLRADCDRRGKADEFEALRPFLTTDANASDYETIGAHLGMKPDTVKVAVHRLRARFGATLREEVRETHADDADVDEELRHLIRLL
jgi:RNA polymerase sigma factor (sigma-70 family)